MNAKACVLALFASIPLCLVGCAADTEDDSADVEDGNPQEMNEAIAEGYSGMFHSPSGKNYCNIDPYKHGYVRCEWQGGGDWAMTLQAGERAHKTHVTDTVYAPAARTLQYGQVIKQGDLRCTVRRTTGITCKDIKTGHGFTMSVEHQTTF
jgi:hypothetical protein